MSTRAVIARETGPNKFKGRYHHFDGHVLGLGVNLWDMYHGYLGFAYKRDLDQMLHVLIDAHPAGWSSIDGDWSEKPGYGSGGPQCYCHGGSREGAQTITQGNAARAGCEYAYVFYHSNAGTPYMRILAICEEYASGPETAATRKIIVRFEQVANINLNGRTPDWDKLNDKANRLLYGEEDTYSDEDI